MIDMQSPARTVARGVPVVGLLVLGVLALAAGARADGGGANATVEWSAELTFELRAFAEDGASSEQDDLDLSLVFEPEYFRDWDEGRQRFAFEPFLRIDNRDRERTHFDLRELYWRKTFEEGPLPGDLYIGLRKVFWGVTESLHLVDIVNQTDLVENLDQEDKLGQPMVSYSLQKNWGTVDIFLLPAFRERTFPGEEGRLRSPFVVDTDNPVYESSAEDTHLDWAVRYSTYVGSWDVALSYFSGTAREPRLLPGGRRGRLIPHYDQLEQAGLELQYTVGGWLWKLESVARERLGEDSFAAVGGFEYTLVGLFGSALDLGLIGEYQYDDREGSAAPPGDDDLVVGGRLTFNDAQDTDLLAVLVSDLDNDTRFVSVEGNRRLGSRWEMELELRLFSNVDPADPFFAFRDEDHLQLSLTRFFD